METDAQRRATLKYRKEHTHQLSMTFFPADEDLWEHLQRQPKKADYVRALIRADMERQRTE